MAERNIAGEVTETTAAGDSVIDKFTNHYPEASQIG